ncbi:MAG: hypothetical protein IPM25_03580 [Chloracidobacterium sp.]|nr:hypothetical protein [Chloracidobacterium sp.]
MGKKIAWSPHGELTEYALNYSAGRKRPILWLLKKVMGRYPLFHSTSDEETEDIKNSTSSPVYFTLMPLAFREFRHRCTRIQLSQDTTPVVASIYNPWDRWKKKG